MTSQAIRNGLNRLRTRIDRNSVAREYSDEHALRAELFSVDQFHQHAKALAARHEIDRGAARTGCCRGWLRMKAFCCTPTSWCRRRWQEDRRITPAAEWLLDNFYLIEEQIRMARRHLPRGYSRELPRCAVARRQDSARLRHRPGD